MHIESVFILSSLFCQTGRVTERPGLRERKRRQTRRRIAEVAMRLFVERGFDHVTVSEVADAADVARVTLFKHFPTKESLVLDAVADDDPARIVASRPPGTPALAAVRAHYRAFAAAPGVEDGAALIAALRVITGSPALTAGVRRLFDAQREALARTLAAEDGGSDPLAAEVAAAQITGAIQALKTEFFRRLVAGEPAAGAVARLADDVDRAFDLVEHGIGDRYGR